MFFCQRQVSICWLDRSPPVLRDITESFAVFLLNSLKLQIRICCGIVFLNRQTFDLLLILLPLSLCNNHLYSSQKGLSAFQLRRSTLLEALSLINVRSPVKENCSVPVVRELPDFPGLHILWPMEDVSKESASWDAYLPILAANLWNIMIKFLVFSSWNKESLSLIFCFCCCFIISPPHVTGPR